VIQCRLRDYARRVICSCFDRVHYPIQGGALTLVLELLSPFLGVPSTGNTDTYLSSLCIINFHPILPCPLNKAYPTPLTFFRFLIGFSPRSSSSSKRCASRSILHPADYRFILMHPFRSVSGTGVVFGYVDQESQMVMASNLP